MSGSYDGVPLIMAYGELVSGTSTAIDFSMAIIRQFERIGGTVNILST
jgi:hypothetical protein